jgi:anti-anti-sigma regulatory factor
MLKIEINRSGTATTIRFIGRIRVEHVNELERLVNHSGSNVSLDLEEVSLVDAEVVRFLASCATGGVRVLQCAPYIAQWIARHQEANR